MVVSISDLYLDKDSCWYSADDGQTKEYFSCPSGAQKTIYLNSVEGSNTWTVGAGDYATNTSGAEVNFNVVPDAVEKKTLENYFKVYPNPVSNIGNFEFYLDAPKDLKFSVYDITGKQLEQRVIEGNAGDNKMPYDFSKYKSGIYIYRFEGSEGKAKTGKIVKKKF